MNGQFNPFSSTMPSASSYFLTLPVELRCEVYDNYLDNHRCVPCREQPSNRHLHLLLTCKQIYDEAKPILQRYVSLLHERQISAFVKSNFDFNRVTYADVANDGRLLVQSSSPTEVPHPLSQLHVALRLLPSLYHLRVFECRRGLPFTARGKVATRLIVHSEQAMFPDKRGPALRSYQLMLLPGTRASPLSILSSTALQRLHLAGDCVLPAEASMPNLKALVLRGVDGNFFDRHTFTQCFPGMTQLQEFYYALLTKTGFELRDKHLESLIHCSGRTLRKLVLIDCNRLTSTIIGDCLANLPGLEYFALSLVTVEELKTNFLLSLPYSVKVLKLKVINAWYASGLHAEERILCATMETFLHDRSFQAVAMRFRPAINEGPVVRNCRRIAWSRGIKFTTESWVEHEPI